MTETLRFEPEDFVDDLPKPGFYLATIDLARYRRSGRGNDMVQVVYVLDAVPERHARVREYFVVAGATERGCAVARRRLLQLFRACGLEPRPGEDVSPADLLALRVSVRVAHEEWEGERRLRVTGYRPPPPPF